MFDDLVRLLVPVLGFGVVALWIAAATLAGIVNNLRLHRALELRMTERIALMERGINPHTLAALPSPSGQPGDDARA